MLQVWQHNDIQVVQEMSPQCLEESKGNDARALTTEAYPITLSSFSMRLILSRNIIVKLTKQTTFSKQARIPTHIKNTGGGGLLQQHRHR